MEQNEAGEQKQGSRDPAMYQKSKECKKKILFYIDFVSTQTYVRFVQIKLATAGFE